MADGWLTSKLVGVAIYGPENKKVGSIIDVLMKPDGNADSMVIGLGGFLGIGEKDVSVAFDQVIFSDQPVAKRMADPTMAPITAQTDKTSTDSTEAANANEARLAPIMARLR